MRHKYIYIDFRQRYLLSSLSRKTDPAVTLEEVLLLLLPMTGKIVFFNANLMEFFRICYYSTKRPLSLYLNKWKGSNLKNK